MTALKRKLSSFLIVIIIIAVAASIASLIYYFKIQKKEESINQMHQRELRYFAEIFDSSIEHLVTTAQFLLEEKQVELRHLDGHSIEGSTEEIIKENIKGNISQIRQSTDFQSLTFENLTYNRDAVSDRNQEKGEYKTHFHFATKSKVEVTFNAPYFWAEHALTLQIDSQDFLIKSDSRFPIVLITNEQGEVVTQKRNNTSYSNIAELNINRITLNDAAMSGSHYQDSEFAGHKVRLYIRALSKKHIDTPHFLVGVMPIEQIASDKLTVSPKGLMWMIIALLLIIATAPLLKMLFVNNGYVFRPNDITFTGLGFIATFGVIAVAANQHLFFSYFELHREQMGEQIFNTIQRDFTKELNAALTIVNQHKAELTPIPKQNTNQGYTNRTFSQNFTFETGLVELIGVVDDKAKLSLNYPIFNASKSLFITVKDPLDLSKRVYVNKSLAGEFWHMSDATNKVQPFYLERIHNIEDSRKNTMLTVPFDDENIIIAGVYFGSLSTAILPEEFSFAVIDKQGNTIYHSNDSRGLTENMFSETNYSQALIQLVTNALPGASRTRIELEYQGHTQQAFIGPLLSADHSANTHLPKPLPWQLVVFHNPYHSKFNNMLMVFLAISLLILVTLPSFLLLRFVATQSFWIEVFHFQKKKKQRYLPWAMFIFSMGLFCLFAQGVIADITTKILLWFAVCIGVLVFLHSAFKIDTRHCMPLRVPSMTLLIMVIIWLCCDIVLTVPIGVDKVLSNYVFCFVGALILVCTYWNVRRKSNHSTAPKQIKREYRYQSDERYPRRYIVYLCSLIFLAAIVPASLISQSTNGYLLQRFADMESIEIDTRKTMVLKHLNNYQHILLPPSNSETDDKATQALKTLFSHIIKEKRCKTLFAFYNKYLSNHDSVNGLSAWIKPHDKIGNSRVFDSFIDTLLSNVNFTNKFGLALMQLSSSGSEKWERTTLFRADMYMQAAACHRFAYVLLSFLCLTIVLYWTTHRILVRGILGEQVSEHFRVVRPCDNKQVLPGFRYLQSLRHSREQNSVLLLNTDKLRAYKACKDCHLELYGDKIHYITDCLDISNEQFKFVSEVEDILNNAPKASNNDAATNYLIIAIYGLEQLSCQCEQRKLALKLLTTLNHNCDIRLIFVADTSPLFRLINPGSYTDSNQSVDIDERLGWSQLFCDIDKEYIWLPSAKQRINNPLQLEKLIDYEANAWPQLAEVKVKFYEYSLRVKQPSSNSLLSDYWTPDQIVEFFLVQAGPVYRKQWELCTNNEKLLLWQISQGGTLNPANAGVLEHLVRRGYLYRDRGWHIITMSFSRFIQSAATAEQIEQWNSTNREGAWKFVRIPIFIAIIAIAAVFYYSSGDSIASYLSIITAMLGLVPAIFNSVNLIKGGTLPESD